MKVSSYNVNGIRAACKKGFVEWLTTESPDVVCIQELKADETQIPPELLACDYHAYWHPAQKKGYSGVGILCKEEPISVEIGCGLDWIDSEGRVIAVEFEKVFVYSLYFPSGTTGDVRQNVKYEFLDAFTKFIEQKRKSTDKELILCGDYNIAHTEIDIHNPVSNKNTSGFLPQEREWFTHFLERGYHDAFRGIHPEKKDVYSWWSYRAGAKKNNKGWRIDYHLVTAALTPLIQNAYITSELDFSDHAPVTLDYEL